MGQGGFRYNDSKKMSVSDNRQRRRTENIRKKKHNLTQGKQSGMKGTIKAKGFAPQGKRVSKLKFTIIYPCH